METTTTDRAVRMSAGKVFSFPDDAAAREFEVGAAATGAEVIRLEAAAPALARPLYDLESHLASLLDTEDVVPPELEQEYALELHATLVATEEKRDAVGHFRQHLQGQIAFAKAEKERLQERQRAYERALERLDGYITRVIDMLGLGAGSKRKKLEGRVCTLGLHGCDQSVQVINEEAVPTRYKRITVTLPAEVWELAVDSLDFDLRDQVLAAVSSPEVEVSKSLVKADLKAEIAVPGAKLVGGTYVEVK